MLSRRRFFLGLVAAPAIVHIGNLMPVKALPIRRRLTEDEIEKIIRPPIVFAEDPADFDFVFRTSIPTGAWRMFDQSVSAADKAHWVEIGQWL